MLYLLEQFVVEHNFGSTVNFTVYFQGNYEIFKYINCNAQDGKIKHMTRILILLLKTEKQRGYKYNMGITDH